MYIIYKHLYKRERERERRANLYFLASLQKPVHSKNRARTVPSPLGFTASAPRTAANRREPRPRRRHGVQHRAGIFRGDVCGIEVHLVTWSWHAERRFGGLRRSAVGQIGSGQSEDEKHKGRCFCFRVMKSFRKQGKHVYSEF